MPNAMQGGRSPWLVVLGSALALIVGNGPVMQFTFGVFLKPIAEEFHISRGATSVVLTIGLATTALCLPWTGRLTDRFGPRRVALVAVACMAFCLVAIATLARSTGMLLVLFVLMGAAATGQTPLPYAKAVTARFDRNRGLALAITLLGVGVGSIVLPLFAQQLVGSIGWRGGYLGIAALLLGIALPSLLVFIPDHLDLPRPNASTTPSELPGHTVGEAVREPRFWLLIAGLFFGAMAANGTVAHIAPLLSDHGVPPADAARALASVGVASIAGRLVAGYLLDRFWAPLVALAFIVGMAAGMGVLALTPTIAAAHVAVWLIGLGLGLEADLVGFLLTRYLGLKAFGALFGYAFGAFVLASSIGPMLMGAMFDATGSYAACLTVFICFAAISAAAFLFMGRYVYPSAGVE